MAPTLASLCIRTARLLGAIQCDDTGKVPVVCLLIPLYDECIPVCAEPHTVRLRSCRPNLKILFGAILGGRLGENA